MSETFILGPVLPAIPSDEELISQITVKEWSQLETPPFSNAFLESLITQGKNVIFVFYKGQFLFYLFSLSTGESIPIPAPQGIVSVISPRVLGLIHSRTIPF